MATIVEEEGPTWMTLIIEYLRDETLPDNQKEERKLRIKARQYKLLEGILYRRSFLKPWLRSREGQVLDSHHGLFHKWIEEKVVAIITGSQVKKFVWDNIVFPFGLPGEIVSDNVKHSQSNGLIERANRSLGEGIKARLVDAVHNDEIRLNLDLLEERREHAVICEAKAKLKMTKYYNARVRGVTFRPGDFVYRSNDASHVVDRGKLGPKWEGPYEVMEALGDGAYKLRSTDGTVLSRTWNITNLKKCYP
nr:hypothetical protein [Tanacetum cinerariifolium]GEX43214.1 hypothetical protein [Tanacetum cinerariifolium]